jgi:hypothetical protein
MEYDIKDVIGIFERNRQSKEIKFPDPVKKGLNKNELCDERGRKVNPKGYLIDGRGNVIDKYGVLIWHSHELQFNEPPKIFPFTEFSIRWIQGLLDRDVTQNPKHDDERDLEGRSINAMGYLIDPNGNVVDIFSGNIVFKKEVLSEKYG